MKRLTALLMAIVMVVALLSACGGNSGSSSTPAPTAADKTADTNTPATNEQPKGERRTLTVGISSEGRGEAEDATGNEYIDDNWSIDFIRETWAEPNNIDLKIQIVDNTGSSSMQNYQLLLASRTAPDLFTVNVGEGTAYAKRLAMEGGLKDLTDALNKYGQTIFDVLGKDHVEKWGRLGDGNEVLAIAGLEPIPAISHYWIRQDWLDTLGLKMPENFDEWYTAMKAFKERANELEAAGRVTSAAAVVPFTMYHTRYFTPWERVVDRFRPTETFDEKNFEYYQSGYGVAYAKKGFREGLSFVNQMYLDGLISPNFAIDTNDEQFEKDILAGNSGSYCTNLFSGWDPSDPNSWHNVVAENIPGAKFEYCDPFTNKYDNVKRNPLDTIVLNWTLVPVFSEAEDLAIQYLSFTNTEENTVKILYGEEGVTFDYIEGLGPIAYPLEKRVENGFKHRLAGGELNMICRLPNNDWSIIRRSNAKTPEQAEYALRIYNSIIINGYDRFPIQLSRNDAKGEYEGTLRDPWQKFIADCIMAAPGTYDATYVNGVKELEASGSQKILDGALQLWNDSLREEVGGNEFKGTNGIQDF